MIMKNQIKIALCGLAESGKDEAANGLYGFIRFALADPVKAGVDAAFNDIDLSQYRKNDVIHELGKSKRDLWRIMGDAFGRNGLGDDVWVDSLLRRIDALAGLRFPPPVVVTDLRRKNEESKLKGNGFFVVRIVRDGLEDGSWRNHASETDIDALNPDLIVFNNGSIQDLHEKMQHVVELLRPL